MAKDRYRYRTPAALDPLEPHAEEQSYPIGNDRRGETLRTVPTDRKGVGSAPPRRRSRRSAASAVAGSVRIEDAGKLGAGGARRSARPSSAMNGSR
jgi:hypothetical protein